MKPKKTTYLIVLLLLLAAVLPDAALATQTHGEPEGLYVHQFAHLFFLVAMLMLAYWLNLRNLVRFYGWRYIQISAFLFVLWNFDAMLVHFLDEQTQILSIVQTGKWHINIETVSHYQWVSYMYYLAKLDHLLSVPALMFLYLGLRRLKSPDAVNKAGDNDS